MFGGGGGARTFSDGVDSGGIMHSMASRICNVETIEGRAPLLQVYRRELRDGAGPGRFRGGAGIESAAMPHKTSAPALYLTFASGVAMPGGRGLSGGSPGAAASSVILRGSNTREMLARGRAPRSRQEVECKALEVLPAKAITILGEDDLLVSITASGSGYGDPLARDPERVAADVNEGLVSVDKARQVYGVAVTAGRVDFEQTDRTRAEIRSLRRRDGRAVTPGTAPEKPDGRVLHPVTDTVEAVENQGVRAFRCSRCGRGLGTYDGDYKAHTVVRELSLAELSPDNALCSGDYVLREYSCPGCMTAIAVDVQQRSEELLPEIQLAPNCK
jgi:N-methylhydantoinase B